MKFLADPIAELRAFFRSAAKVEGTASGTICYCSHCTARRVRPRASEAQRYVFQGVGVFGARSPLARSRYREHLEPDLFHGRRAGRGPDGREHVARTCVPMPSPARRSSAEIVWYEIRKEIGEELASEAYVSFLEQGGTVNQVCERVLRKNLREVGRFIALNLSV